MDDQSLTALVYPDRELAANRWGDNEKALREALDAVRIDVNKGLPMNARISEIKLRNEPFEKTPTRKIKRALYIPGY
jgi:long-chain acyl-CoA synthetase